MSFAVQGCASRPYARRKNSVSRCHTSMILGSASGLTAVNLTSLPVNKLFIVIESIRQQVQLSILHATCHFCFPLLSQNSHADQIIAAAIAIFSAARLPFVDESAFHVGANRLSVCCNRIERDAMQIQFLKRVPQNNPHRIGPVSLAAILRLTNANPDPCITMRKIHTKENHKTNGLLF